ncbi:unnamed protein product [Brachionus calyciflorus]|uniref:Vitelline membrane outer layer 1-like protein n=1 Tax=Brachionus calyciflorus TaxID=104777 RepID=A0A813NQJ0_9BILA|nr:unnamed protein product [Brachionus calyciflorus]
MTVIITSFCISQLITSNLLSFSWNSNCISNTLLSDRIPNLAKCFILCQLTDCKSIDFNKTSSTCKISKIKEHNIGTISGLTITYTADYPMRTLSTDINGQGIWYDYDYCPLGSYAVGFNVKVDLSLTDKTGLNTIQLICNDVSNTKIVSYDGLFGTWGTSKFCSNNQKLTGFKLRYQSSLLGLSDDSAANSIVMYCEDKSALTPSLEGYEGSWYGAYYCTEGRAICGLSVQYESSNGIFDDTALNNVIFKCCTF